ncbi:hypothetical protein GWI33_009437 [Rhynchophorus ferrugineus]|uniref:Uncharacterized protein n=1 Tax=Rhynchophorus ferrugineus TaxID=354439 RepID=A0A834MC70_RHYFE|nr:hypothetical protein GWI33_010701 [Rhynchophorus ferrugineus]KAF7277111.1 hypothetical protein GWI33_009437 [Rhynchophorus ferrugineus]
MAVSSIFNGHRDRSNRCGESDEATSAPQKKREAAEHLLRGLTVRVGVGDATDAVRRCDTHPQEFHLFAFARSYGAGINYHGLYL